MQCKLKYKALPIACAVSICTLLLIAQLVLRMDTWVAEYEKHHPDSTRALNLNATVLQMAKTSRVLMYNRVNKCGSRTVLDYLKKLENKNLFNFVNDKRHFEKKLNATRQKEFAVEIHGLQKPLLYVRHVYFVDFKQFGHEQPMYFNLARDPVDRMVSHYYFDRTSHREYIIGRVGIDNYNKTINECVEKKLDECVNLYSTNTHQLWGLMPYFCGQDPICLSASQEAVDIAKRNVERYFAVVGVLEDFPAFIDVMESLFPTYFTGFKAMHEREEIHTNPTRDKHGYNLRLEPPTQTTRDVLTNYLYLEYDFYFYIKQRFRALANYLNVKTKL